MKDNIIDFAEKQKANKLYESNEIGKITISVLVDSQTNTPYFYLLPDKAELLPIVDVIEESLLKHIFIHK